MTSCNWLLIIFGTVFFTGYIPIAPATVSSLATIPLVLLLAKDPLVYILVTIGIIIIGAIVADKLEKRWSKDARQITIDECAGIMLTFLLLPINWKILIIGFVLFRFFDIVKPLYIRSSEKVTGGIGIMLDDILSGIYSNIILRILLLILPTLG